MRTLARHLRSGYRNSLLTMNIFYTNFWNGCCVFIPKHLRVLGNFLRTFMCSRYTTNRVLSCQSGIEPDPSVFQTDCCLLYVLPNLLGLGRLETVLGALPLSYCRFIIRQAGIELATTSIEGKNCWTFLRRIHSTRWS